MPPSDLVEPTYHSDTRERGLTLFRGLGTFWADAFAGRREIDGLMQGLSVAADDLVRRFERLSDTLAVDTVPYLTARSWWLLPLTDPDRITGFSYDEPPEPSTYDQVDTTVGYALPSNLIDFVLVTPATHAYTKAWWFEQDVRIDRAGKRLVFTEDPKPYAVTDAAGRSYVWLYRPRFATADVYGKSGYLINRREPDGKPYRDFVAAVVHERTEGPSAYRLRKALAAALEAPIAEIGDTVTDVSAGGTGETVVATKTEAFVVRDGLTTDLRVGDELPRGEPVGSRLKVYEHRQGQIGNDVGVTHPFPLDGKTYWLSFSAREQPVTRPTPTSVRFPLGGEPDGVEAYWRAADASGKLATWIDGDTVVPAEIVADRILRYGWVTAEVDAKRLSSRAVDRLRHVNVSAASALRVVCNGPTTNTVRKVGNSSSSVSQTMPMVGTARPVSVSELLPILSPDGPC